jgi:hypothetical protein
MIMGCQITIETDSLVFSNLFSSKNLSQQLICWINTFTEFDVKIKKIAGSENKMADLLSRNCSEEFPVEPRIICLIKDPCQICKGSSETI